MNIYMKKGFTLIKLLIVIVLLPIAIIGILVGVGFVSLENKIDTSKTLVQESEARQLRTIAGLYAATNNGNYTGVCTASNGLGKADAANLINFIASTGKGSNITVGNLVAGEVKQGIVFCNANEDGFIFVYKQTNDTIDCVDAQQDSLFGTRLIGTTSSGLKIPVDGTELTETSTAFTKVTCN